MNLQFRIHREYKDVSGVVVSLMERCEMGFVFEHPEDEKVNRTHVHGYMFGSQLKSKTVSQDWIKKKLGLVGNKDFGVSDKCSEEQRPLDLSGAYCYGSKWDTIAPKILKNISPDLVDLLKSYARSKRELHNIARGSNTIVIKEIKVKQKPTQYQHVTTVVERLNTIHPDLYSKPLAEQRRCIFDTCFDYFRQNELFMGKYKQLDFMDMVLLKWNCTEYKNLLFSDFTKRTSQYIV